MIMRKVYYILLCCVWLGQVACQDKGTEVGGQGRIRLSITDRVISKALPDALSPELTDRFQVEMIRLEDNRLVFGLVPILMQDHNCSEVANIPYRYLMEITLCWLWMRLIMFQKRKLS